MIVGLTIYAVFRGEDLETIVRYMKEANPLWIAVSMLMVLGFVFCESVIIRMLFAKLKIKTGRMECFLYSCVGFFFCAVTPSASGGQPAQMVYMKKRGIRVSTSTNVLMWVTIFYKMTLVLIGLVLIGFRLDFIRHYMGNWIWIFYLGIVLNIGCVAIMVMLWIKSEWLKAIGNGGITLLNKLKLIRKPKKKRERLERFITNYDDSFVALRGEIPALTASFFLTVLQRMMLFAITGFVYLAFGLKGTSFIDVVILQSVISIAVDMLPLPGGSGITEHLFLVMFAGIFTSRLLLPAMVLSRGIAFYVQLLFCGVMTVVAHIYFVRKQRKMEGEKI